MKQVEVAPNKINDETWQFPVYHAIDIWHQFIKLFDIYMYPS